MGKRRHRIAQHEEPENHERWLVSYADFITLLFAFFVVMYAISSVNEGKYRTLSNALNTAFRDAPADAPAAMVMLSPIKPIIPASPPAQPPATDGAEHAQQREQIALISRQVQSALGNWVKDGQAHVSDGAFGVTLDINSSLLFAPGEARLNPAASGMLSRLADTFAETSFPIVVEGHTDNAPIATAAFPSNWELSGMRAASLVRFLIDSGISPVRLSAVGYADQRPLADNATENGRERNRRVSITIAVPEKNQAGAKLSPR